jgi:hypothetical protein
MLASVANVFLAIEEGLPFTGLTIWFMSWRT